MKCRYTIMEPVHFNGPETHEVMAWLRQHSSLHNKEVLISMYDLANIFCHCPQTPLYDQDGYVVTYLTLHTKPCTYAVYAKL